MSKRYQVLARKYRPQLFSDVVGQEAAIVTLKNAIRFERLAHAYLFCGSRGVGKTTIARLFAKAINCASPSQELEPCNQCPSCQEITAGQSLDVIEIDGASNRGIDDIRQINETVAYAPSHGRYKIYIIDEVHMLTKEAFNALLKTLEEPPEKVKFFFATTEPHKVLPTIISRCQRFDLARIQPTLIVSKLHQIAQDLNRSVEKEALELIASFSEGSLRDAESLFDQILCFSESTITGAIVRQTLGLAPIELFSELDEAFSTAHLPFAFELVDKLFQMGKDLSHFLEQLIEHYRNIVHAKVKNLPSGKFYTQSQALHILDLLVESEGNFQKSPFPRIALESILLQIIRSKNRIPVEVLVRQLIENSDKISATAEITPSVAVPEIAMPIAESVAVTEVAAQTIMAEPVAAPEAPSPKKEEAPLMLRAVPFNPYKVPPESPALESPLAAVITTAKALPKEPSPKATPPEGVGSSVAQKPQSHYDTVIRFAAVEFEGIIKN